MNAATSRIDAHQHFWEYSAEEYGWIGDDMGVLRRDFRPDELRGLVSAAGIDGVVSVQARQSLEETRWLLQLAAEDAFIRGIVGWVPLAGPQLSRHLEEFGQYRKLKGIRHFIQAEPDDEFLARDDFNLGIRELCHHSLAFDILVTERQMPLVTRFVDRHPRQTFVLDHLGKPRIRERIVEPWRQHIFELGRRPNVTCKMSGLVTEADLSAWRPADLQPYVEIALEAFGPERLMFGSDWPVCLLATSYNEWQHVLAGMLSALSEDERGWIWGRTATRVYALGEEAPAPTAKGASMRGEEPRAS
jgi:L-fuconolactonase